MGIVHATCVAVSGTGVLLRGAAGSGKSDLALRLIDGGARLVADDQVSLSRDGERLVAAAPPEISGRMEVRGLGIVEQDPAGETEVGLVIDLIAPEKVARLPEPAQCELLGVAVPVIALAPFEASAAAKVRLAVAALNRARMDGR